MTDGMDHGDDDFGSEIEVAPAFDLSFKGAQFGNNNRQKNNFYIEKYVGVAPAAETVYAGVSWPIRIGFRPPVADSYQRRGELDEVHLEYGDSVVLCGMGGAGKSQLAAAIASSSDELDLLVWTSASSRQHVVSSFADAARQLGQQVDNNAERSAQNFISWLASTERYWLVVLDDVSDPVDLRGLWPTGPTGWTLSTTRRRDAAMFQHGRKRVDVGLFTPEQSHSYLREKLASSDDGDDIVALARDLEFLPLALAQAASFMTDRGESCRGYRQRLASTKRRLRDLFPRDALADSYDSTVAATWEISIEAADTLSPVGLARPLLAIASTLDPAGFPSELAESSAVIQYVSDWRSRNGQLSGEVDDVVDGLDCRDALHNLARLNLLTLATGDISLALMHSLVQRATIETIETSQIVELVDRSAQALLEIWPDYESDSRIESVRRRSAECVRARFARQLDQGKGYHPLSLRLANSLRSWGHSHQALQLWETLVATSTYALGPSHPDTRMLRRGLGNAIGLAGRPELAVESLAALLRDHNAVGDPNGRETLRVRVNLAHWLGRTGNVKSAIEQLEGAYDDFLVVVGGDDQDLLSLRQDLAVWRGRAGNGRRAVLDLEELERDRARVEGEEHPHTLSTRHALAQQRGELGDVMGAIAEFEKLLKGQLQVVGPHHPTSLRTRGSIARYWGKAGQIDAAKRQLAQLVHDYEEHLGADHVRTLGARSELARWRTNAGDLMGSLQTHQALLARRLELLGPNHLSTIANREAVADLRSRSGDLNRAAAEYQATYADRLRLMSPDHPQTLVTRATLAQVRGQSGDVKASLDELEEVAQQQTRILGSDAPATLHTQGRIVYWLGRAGHTVAAVTRATSVLEGRLRVFGPEHPQTLTARGDLAYAQGRAGDVQKAVRALDALFADRTALLGEKNLQTLASRYSLAHWTGQTGEVLSAIAQFEELLAIQNDLLGGMHPSTLNTRHQLATWRGRSGDIRAALQSLDELLPQREAVLGDAHPQVLVSRSERAYWIGQSGDNESAMVEFRKILDDRIRILGPSSPQTLSTRSSIASQYCRMGDHDEALREKLELLSIRKSFLRDGHQDILVSQSDIAHENGHLGDIGLAADRLEDLLVRRLRLLGATHPQTLATRAAIAHWHGVGGDHATAIREMEDLVPDRIEEMGPTHPKSLESRSELARWCAESGDYEEALRVFESVLDVWTTAHGENHRHTIGTRLNLGHWAAKSGDIDRGVAEIEQAHTQRVALLGKDHPSSKASERQLKRWRGSGLSLAEARQRFPLGERVRATVQNVSDTSRRAWLALADDMPATLAAKDANLAAESLMSSILAQDDTVEALVRDVTEHRGIVQLQLALLAGHSAAAYATSTSLEEVRDRYPRGLAVSARVDRVSTKDRRAWLTLEDGTAATASAVDIVPRYEGPLEELLVVGSTVQGAVLIVSEHRGSIQVRLRIGVDRPRGEAMPLSAVVAKFLVGDEVEAEVQHVSDEHSRAWLKLPGDVDASLGGRHIQVPYGSRLSALLTRGQTVKAKVVEVQEFRGRPQVSLSLDLRRWVKSDSTHALGGSEFHVGQRLSGEVTNAVEGMGVFVKLSSAASGLVRSGTLGSRPTPSVGEVVAVEVIGLTPDVRKRSGLRIDLKLA